MDWKACSVVLATFLVLRIIVCRAMECPVCQKTVEAHQPSNVLRNKGCAAINSASKERGDSVHAIPGDTVHEECRKRYVRPENINKFKKQTPLEEQQQPRLRSQSVVPFSFQECCLFCGLPAKLEGKKRGHDVFAVRTIEFQKTLKDVCLDRNDAWANEVRGRLECISDLPAADALYHQACSVNFRTSRNIPQVFTPNKMQKKQQGRPTCDLQDEAFKRVMKFLVENPEEQHSISFLVRKMEEEVGSDAYSSVYMKSKLKKSFGSSITISEESGCSSVVTLTSMASHILNNFYKEPKTTDTEEEKRRIISTAAKLIKCDIKETANKKSTSNYPTAEEVSSTDSNIAFVPDSLQLLLRNLFSEKDVDLKVASIGQAIMQSTTPRGIIAPLQLGLGIQAHHQFGSRFLVDTLNSLGFCLSYSEVQSYERNAAMSYGTEIEGVTRDHVIQFVADNVDHNLRTLDGKGTFHGMGIIAGITPQTPRRRPIPRNDVSLSDVTSLARINIEFFNQSKHFDSLTFNLLLDTDADDDTRKLDTLSMVTWPLRPQRPGWSAMMQAVTKGNCPGKSSIVFLPIIDLDPNDLSCIYSTLKFVCREAEKHNYTPVLTFDQPLYWKAIMIQASESSSSPIKDIVLRLGGFHLEMSFLGCIGHLMGNSGLQETLETVFASNAVGHMMSGKAVQRALRGHFIVDTALHAILLSNIYDITLPEIKEEINNEDSRNETSDDSSLHGLHSDLVEADKMLENLLSDEVSVESVLLSDVLDTIQNKLALKIKSLEEKRTAKLWVQYMHMVKLLRRFIKAERTGHWFLHLKTVREMLPYFAAAGHNLYTKSAYVYLQKMQELEKEHPQLFHAFVSGYHILRRSDRFWAGLSTDLVIEQILMRSIKSTGGLTRGRGMSEQQRSVWLLSMPACADINQAMQDATDVNYITNEQHKECTKSRRERDKKDTTIVLDYLLNRNPFDGDKSLRNIETGETDNGRATADDARRVGEDILKRMEGQKVNEYVFRKCNQAITLSSVPSERTSSYVVEIDPQLLFQRLTLAADSYLEDTSSLFKYELSTFPSSLFESSGLLRAAQKATLADAIWNMNDCSSPVPKNTDIHHILDGGSLLHRIPWERGLKFSDICGRYLHYIKVQYGTATVVFDGYMNGPSTKDSTHIRRTGGCSGPKVNLSANVTFRSKKERFLSNDENKQAFINMLSKVLTDGGCKTIHADDDADTLIAKTAIQSAASICTVVIGEDTDLLVLLLYHASLSSSSIFFHSDMSTNRKLKVWDIQKTKSVLGNAVCNALPFLRAITGCDTTSRIFGVGKAASLKKLQTDTTLQKHAEVFCRDSPSAEVIIAGEKAVAILTNGNQQDKLDVIRHHMFVEKIVCKKSSVQVHTLPPTSAAAECHSKRVYLQVQTWLKLESLLPPEEWGWFLHEGKYRPETTRLPPAPPELLKIIRCNCKKDCDSKRCSCRKHGLECTLSCGECKGVSCSNGQIPNNNIVTSEQMSDDFLNSE